MGIVEMKYFQKFKFLKNGIQRTCQEYSNKDVLNTHTYTYLCVRVCVYVE